MGARCWRRVRRKPKEKPDSRPPSPDDEWLDYTTTQVADAIIAWLKGTVNVKRAVCTLTKEEVKALAGCAMARHQAELDRRELTQRPYLSPEETSMKILLGG